MDMYIINIYMVPSYTRKDVYFIFRSNGEEVEIDVNTKTVSHQITFSEHRYINDFYPFIEIHNFKIRKKIYN